MIFRNINLQKMNSDNLSSLLIMIVLLSIISLFLIYLILNIKNKMNNFIKIYDDEQDIQEENLKKTFKEIDKNNSNLETLIKLKNVELEHNVNDLNELGSDISNNTKNIQNTKLLINNLKDIPIKNNNNRINIGSNNEISIGNGNIDFKLDSYKNLKVCDNAGENCSFVINQQFVDSNLPIIPSK